MSKSWWVKLSACSPSFDSDGAAGVVWLELNRYPLALDWSALGSSKCSIRLMEIKVGVRFRTVTAVDILIETSSYRTNQRSYYRIRDISNDMSSSCWYAMRDNAFSLRYKVWELGGL